MTPMRPKSKDKDRTTDEERNEKDGTMGFTSKDIETFTLEITENDKEADM